MAYIDPNTGGMVVQILATSFALLSGIALVFARQIRMAVARLLRSLRRLPDSDKSQGQDET